MRQRGKVQRKVSETLVREEAEVRDGAYEAEKEKKGFYACYLLVSLNPRHKGHTYIGFTVNPRRRIRQHNGEIGSGAWRTKKRRPWEMVFCIYGFPTNVSALQFEWAWQHPIESLAVRKAAIEFKSRSGIANKIKLAYTMLTLPSWQSLNITINYFSTKYVKHSAGCPKLPENTRVKVSAMDELPCYRKGDVSLFENDDDLDNEEFDETTFADKFTEETSSYPPLFNDSLDHQNGTNENCNERCQRTQGKDCTEESSFTDLPVISSANIGNSFTVEVEGKDCTKQSSFTDLPVMSSENVDNSFVIDVEDGDLPLFNEDNSYIRPTRDHLTTTVSDSNQPGRRSCYVPNEIEIIDVTTPSPLCRASVHGKKRRISSGCPEIIDLTKSPSFVQL